MADSGQPTDFYYNSRGDKIPLVVDSNLYAVRYLGGQRSDSPQLSAVSRQFLSDDSEHLEFLAHYGLQVRQVKPGATLTAFGTDTAPPADPQARQVRVERALASLDQEPPVEFVTPVYRQGAAADPVYTTNLFVAEFKAGVTEAQIDQLNAAHGVQKVAPLAYALPALGYVLQAPSGVGDSGPLALSRLYFESGLVRYSAPDLIQKRSFRGGGASAPAGAAVPAWTYQAQQWHLATAGVVDAWASGTGDPSVVVALADDGFDVTHPELAGKIVIQYDFESGIADATPKTSVDNHGTACAGVATAAGVNARGAAPSCRFMAVRCPAYLGSVDEGNMFQWMADKGADVISCSWGPPDGRTTTYPLADNVASAIHYCATQGRGGKGIPIFWAAGNGNESVTTDGYASCPDVMAITSSTDADTKAYYSDFGPPVFMAAPSSGLNSTGQRRIFTIDRQAADGYNPGTTAAGDAAGNYTNSFGGTSSSAPLAAGIGALVLSANPALTVADVRDILRQTADKIGGAAEYDAQGHSINFGYGRVNTAKAVIMAASRKPAAGGVPVVPPKGAPSIAAPAQVPRTAPPPQFAVSSGDNLYFAVEVAADALLFDAQAHGANRTSGTFYGSWTTGLLLSGSSYTLPADVWQSLSGAAVLYYRLLTSAAPDKWVTPAATSPNANAKNAPSIEILAPGAPADLSIQAPASCSRSGPPPVFSVHTGANQFYAIEVATSANLFDQANSQALRNAQNFYASWASAGLIGTPSFQMPQSAWDGLKPADRLFYRLITTASPSAWTNAETTTPDSQAAGAPSIQMTGNASQTPIATRFRSVPTSAVAAPTAILPGPVTPAPVITGPETYDRTSPVQPSFLIAPGPGRYFAVEVATDPASFDANNPAANRDGAHFFASWQQGPLLSTGADASGSLTYRLPLAAWKQLSVAATLFYRALTSSAPNMWSDSRESYPATGGGAAPAIVLKGRAGARMDFPISRPEEALWRQDPPH